RGKPTLIRLALGLERPLAGRAFLFGEPAHRYSRRRTLGYLAQRSKLGTEAPATVREVVATGRMATGRLLGPLRAQDRLLIDEAIARVGLSERAAPALHTLSGGQPPR